MSLKVFSLSLVIENHPKTKKRDTCSFQCMEACGKNLYFGTKDCVVQHFVLTDESFPDSEEKCPTLKQVKIKQMGMRRPVTQLKASPELNHLILLCDNTVTVLNMFSLEPVQTMRKIRNVASFHVNETATAPAPGCIELFTVSSKKKTVHLYMVSIDKSECVKEVSFLEEPLALAVDGNCLCVATSERYVLHDYKNGTTVELFPHNREKQATIVELAGRGEFLLNGPGSLGYMKCNVHSAIYFTGLCKEYISMPDIRQKRIRPSIGNVYVNYSKYSTIFLTITKLLLTSPVYANNHFLSRSENVFVLTENTVYSLTPVPVEEQLDALLKSEKTDEALDLVQGVKPLFSKDTYKVLCKSRLTRAGDVTALPSNSRTTAPGLWKDRFLAHRAGSLPSDAEVPGSSPRRWGADLMRQGRPPEPPLRYNIIRDNLTNSNAFFCTWIKIVDGHHHENMHFDVYSHIVDFLCCETDLEVVWKYADWVLKKNQEMGVHIFTKRKNNQKSFVEDDVLNMLKKYSLALIFYLEYLVNDLKSEDEKHHTLLVTTYVDQILVIMEKQGMESGNLTLTVKRNKLQDLLQETSIYNTAVVQDKLMKTGLHVEKAILNGRAGQHEKALWILVNKERDICAAENYCRKNSLGRGKEFGNMLFLSLLKLYLDSDTPNSNARVIAAVDLLNNNAAAFDPASVLQVLPDSWSLQLISRFLVESLRSMTHYRRMGKIERNLAQAEHLLYRYLWVSMAAACVNKLFGYILYIRSIFGFKTLSISHGPNNFGTVLY
ncbi:TGFA1 protein, partial [Atractosteus spatula]|nr:TGFA1 protein [Atractosteus spatula]